MGVVRELVELARELIGENGSRLAGVAIASVTLVVGSTIAWVWYVAPFDPAVATALDGTATVDFCGPQVSAAPWTVTQRRLHTAPFELAGHQLTPVAQFAVTARVLSQERYRLDELAAIAPLDLALGWGPMASPTLSGIRFSQGGRFGFYEWGPDAPSVPPGEIDHHFANVHVVPANATVARALDTIAVGQTVELTGRLVDIRKGGKTWHTSTTRQDIGPGACEIVYVCGARVLAV